ncbi:unnamed protein product, partial [marine sediment metagenome]
MTQEYFDALVPNYAMEVPGEKDPETSRRLLYMFKVAINGKACVLNNASTDPNTPIAISPEFVTKFGYTFEEFAALEPADFFHEDSLPVAMIHSANNLAAPFIARCKHKNESYAYFKIQGLTVTVDDINWR